MEKVICSLCEKNKTALNCGVCGCTACKYCAHILDENTFSFLSQIPAELSHGVYCPTCFADKVAAPLEDYNQKMEKAGDIDVFFKKQGKESRLIRRELDPVKVDECSDRDELILRLAFKAVEAECNTLVDVEVNNEKIIKGSYQSTKWSGSGVPANANEKTVIHDKSFTHYPN